MLSIGKLGKGQERYYLGKVAEGAEDYYSGEGEEAGQWTGDAAARLGLEGEVGEDQLVAILTGRNPVDGLPLLGTSGVPASGSVPGFDLTFSAPKSVSLLWGLGRTDIAVEVKAAHREAVQTALAYMQREACWTRRGAGGSEFVKGNGYLAAAYVHRSSRNGDPQLHTHVLVANATQGPDGRWTRLYHPAIYDHATTASYLYEAHLRDELSRRLGVEWQPARKGIAEIEGVADEHLRAFSTRRAEILEAVGENASAASRQVATLATRKPKEADISQVELRQRWRSKADEIGLDQEAIERTLGVRDPTERYPALTVQRLDRAVTEGQSHFGRRDAIQAVADSLRNGAQGVDVERMADEFLAADSVIQVAESAKGPRYTTRRIWELEREALAAVERMNAERATVAGELIAARVIESRPTLKDDQRELVRRLLADPEGVAVVIGEAGTGKTHAIAAAAEGWAQAGIDLRIAAPTWRAANVLRSDGLSAVSVATLLSEFDQGKREGGEEALAQGSALVIDEAGMVDSARLARLIDHAEQALAKLVLVGDPEQLGEIEAGGLFRAIAERTDPIRLEEVIRHEHKVDREATKLIRKGEGGDALGLYVSKERVTVAPDADAMRAAMVADWHEAYERGEDVVMIAKRNRDVERLNATAREVRRQEEKLGAEEIEVGEAPFAAGDQVITRVNDRQAEIYNRERWQVAEVDAERRRVVLDGIDQARRVEVEADYLARTNPYSDAPALEHAYAVTTYSAQGTTVDQAFVMADPSMDKQELYVAASRSRGETFIYVTPEVQSHREEIAPVHDHSRDALPHIAEAAERDRAQLAAHDAALRSQFSGLPTGELIARSDDLRIAASHEAKAERQLRDLRERIERAERQIERYDAQREWAQELKRRFRKDELARIDRDEAKSQERLAGFEAEARGLPVPSGSSRRELAVVDRVLAERRELAITAARISPPTYIAKELGQRPADPSKCRHWDRGVADIEQYRQRYGVKDRSRAFGPESKRSAERARQEQARRQLLETQRVLGLGRHKAKARALRRGLGLFR
jgi:conjugative relaxase-like TrwC/TraI family protein